MTHQRPNIIINGSAVNLEQLKQWQDKPEPFTPGEPLFWDDPHISTQMLAAHLDPTNDRASRRPETIERSVTWIVKTLGYVQALSYLIWAVDQACMRPVWPNGDSM